MTDSFGLPPAPVIPIVVQSDTPCRKCGYNLRNLASNSRCPECGVAVAASISGDLLEYCDPAWVATLARGATLIVAGIVVIILAVVGVVVMTAAMGPSGAAAGTLGGFVGNVLMVIGSWLLTSPDPSGIGEDRYGTSRKVIRVTLLIGACQTLTQFAEKTTVFPPPVHAMLLAFGAIAGLAGVVGLIAQLQYFEKLAHRLPDDRLAARARSLKFGLPICYGIIVLLGIAVIVVTKGAGGPAAGGVAVFGCVAALVGIALLVYGIMYLLLIDRYRRALVATAQRAAANWSAHVGS